MARVAGVRHADGMRVDRRLLSEAALLLFLAPAMASGCRSQEGGSVPLGPSASSDAWTPEAAGWVTDLSELLSPEEERNLAASLQNYRDETGHELAVLIVPGLRGETIESLSLRVARSWRLGRAGVDDGLLVLLAPGECRIRVEVGDGLTEAVPDTLAAEVIEREFIPAFRRGDWVGGLDAGLRALMDAGRAAR